MKHSAMAEKIKVLRKKLQLMILSSFLCLSLGFGRVSKVRAQSVVGAESTVSSAMQTKTRNAAVTEREPSRKQFAERGVAHVEIEVSKNAADKTSHIEEIFMESMIASHSSPAAALSVEQGGVGKSRGGATAGSESSAKNDRGFKSSSNSNSRNQKNSAFGVVELKEAEKEVKESLYGLADFMKGGWVGENSINIARLCRNAL